MENKFSFSSDIRFAGKMYKTDIKHNLGYAPIIQMACERVNKRKRKFPMWVFLPGYISCTDFYFKHEKYSKKDFRFHYMIFKNDDPISVEKGTV